MGKDITINYFQAVHVAKVVTNLAPYATISGAIGAITDNSATKRYAVYVHPGTYTEQIIMKDYIDVIAVGGREETIITHLCTADNQATVTGENSMIKGFTIVSDGATGAWTTRCVTNALDGFELEDCVLIATAPKAAAVTFSATASCTMRSCQVDILAAAATAVSLDTDTENYVLYDNLIGGAITSLLINDCLTTTISGGELRNLLDHDDCATSTIARNVIFEEIDFDGGTRLQLDACYVLSIAANAGGAVVAYGGTIRLCNIKVTDASFIWWLDDDNLHVLENMLIQDAITAASPEDVIHLDAVRYTERITLADGVHLEGATDATDTLTEIYDTTAAAVITAGAVESSIRQVKITQTNAGAAAYCVSVTDAAVLVFSHCTFDCNGTDAIHMVNGSVTLEVCTLTAGNIDLSTLACILRIDHCEVVAGDIVTATDVNHSIIAQHTDFSANNITNNATGATTIEVRFCGDILSLTDAGVGGTTLIENSVIVTGTKSGTSPWTVRLARIASLSNNNGTGDITAIGGFIGACGGATGSVVWWHDSLDEMMVISGMLIAHAITAAGATGDTIRLGQGTWAEALAVTKSINFIGEGLEESQIILDSAASPIFLVGDIADATVVTCTFQGLTISNTATASTGYGLELDAGTANTTVVVRECFIDGYDAAVHVAVGGGGTQTFEAFESSFFATTICVDVDDTGAVTDIDIHNCEVTGGAFADLAGAAHTLDVWDTECGGGAVTGDANNPVVNLTRCNDVGTITNAGTGNWVIEHCTTGDIATSSTGDITIENSNVGILTQTDAGGDMFVYNSYVTKANPTLGDMDFYGCYIAEIDCAGGNVRVYGGTIILVSASTGVVTWKTGAQVYEVLNVMDIGEAITAAAGETPSDIFRFTVKVHEGEYNEAVTMAQWVDLVGDSGESCVIYQSGANVIIAAANSRIRNVRVELLAGSDDSAIYVNNVTGVVIEECTITVARTSGNNSGILTAGSGGAEVYRCSIEATAAEDAAIVCEGTGATELYNNDLNGGLADINLNADVDGDLQTYNNNCRGAGFRIVAVDTYNVYAHGDVFKTVTHLLAAGVRGHMFLQNEPNIALVREGMYITDGIALATADTPGAANPWKVQVGPGVYTEQVAMDDYVNVVAEGGYEVTSIFHECAAADDEATVTMESNCRLEGFTIISDGNGDTYEARCITSIAKSNWLIKDCLFSHVDSSAAGGADNQCVFIDTSGTGLRLEHCRWRSGTIAAPTTDDIKRALQVDADGIEVLLQDCETYSDTTAATDSDFFLNEGKVETRNCMIRGGGWYISDNATSIGISWDDDWEGTKVIQVTFAGTNGQFADLSGARLYTCTIDETLGEAVYISAAETVDEATNAAATPLPAEGIIVYKPSNVLCYVKKHGYVYLADPGTLVGVTFTAGGNIWLGATAGKWLNAEPSNAIKQILGVAKGPTGAGAAKEFLIDISLVVIETASFTDHTPTGGVLSIPIAWGAGSAATGTHISNNARRAVVIVNAAGQTVFSQAVDIPSDYLHDAANNKLFAVLFPTGGAATDIDWTAYTCCASHGEDEAFHSDTATADDQDVDDDEILFLDISAAFLTTYTAEEGDVLSIELIIDVMDAPVTQVNVLEFKLIYTRQV